MSAAPAPVARTWVVLGSSTAAGAGASSGAGWVAQIEKNYGARGVRLVNAAKNGLTSWHALPGNVATRGDRPAPDPQANIDFALAQNPGAILLAFPTNDIAQGYSAAEVIANLTTLRRLAAARGIPALVVGTQPRILSAERLALLTAIDNGLAAEFGACMTQVRASLAGPDGRIAAQYDSGDGVHLNNAGHQVIADAVRQTIDSKACISVN